MPIIRETDGLAMSSRNMYLSEDERRSALALNQSLEKALSMVEAGERSSENVIKAIKELISRKPLVKIDYISIVDMKDFKDVSDISGEVLVALAAFVGKTRLIDNIIIKV